jgi:hypothetical protein
MISIDFVLDLCADNYAEDAELRGEVGRIMDQLLALENAGCGISDAAISLDLATSTVSVELVAQGKDFQEAVTRADSSVRAAIHAAGGHTPQWRVTASTQRLTESVTA